MKREEEGATHQAALSKKEDSDPCADESYPVTPALPPLGGACQLPHAHPIVLFLNL